MSRYDYFYANQQLRFVEQVVRAFSGFQYATGRRNGAAPILRVVPVMHTPTSRMVAHIMRNLSENSIQTVPLITVFQSGLTYAKDRQQSINHIDTQQVREREIDPLTGRYTVNEGNAYSVYRLMPRPFDMKVQVDVWTSNLHQKYQLEEQILTIFTPSIDIQNSENPLDWSALTVMELEDYNRSSRSIPIGTENEIDIMSFTFKIPMWLSPPAMVQHQQIIQQIITNVYDGEVVDGFVEGTALIREISTLGDHMISIDGNEITLLGSTGLEVDANGDVYNWTALFEEYNASLEPGTTRLQLSTEIGSDNGAIRGTLTAIPDEPNKLLWQIDLDTLPANTLTAIDAIVNPLTAFPGNGLPAAAAGQRYLLVNDIGSSPAWGNLSARENDIIQHNGTDWVVVFDALATEDIHYVLNNKTGKQLRWQNNAWAFAIDGRYPPGYWKLRF